MKTTYLNSQLCTPKWRFIFTFVLQKTGIISSSRIPCLHFIHQYKKKSISEKQDVNIKFTCRTYLYSQIQIISLFVDRKQIALSTIALIKLPSILSWYRVQDSIFILWPSHGSSEMPRDFWIYRARSWLTVLLLQKYRGGKTKII